jgi:hypothetical protein
MCNEVDAMCSSGCLCVIKKGLVFGSDGVHHRTGSMREMEKLVCSLFLFAVVQRTAPAV